LVILYLVSFPYSPGVNVCGLAAPPDGAFRLSDIITFACGDMPSFVKMLFECVICFLFILHGLGAEFPEVIPGPGLPSLVELGFKSSDLFTTGWANCECLRRLEEKFFISFLIV
jgi:hypothetical protein